MLGLIAAFVAGWWVRARLQDFVHGVRWSDLRDRPGTN